MQPSALLWSVPLALMVVLRGHVYAAPAHVLHALGQCIAVPAAGAAAGALLRASLEGGAGIHACLAPDRIPLLALRHVVDLGGGLVAMPNPITWLAGALVALGVGLLAVVSVLTRFRLQRLPGRLQIRLPGSLPTYQARGAWILLLAATAPTAPLMLALLAIALANGILGLSDDAPGFGVAISLAALAFAVSFLVRAWDLAAGTADAAAITDALNIVPWSELHACATGAPGIAAAPPASAA
ncbi:MAG TPA: hypothetical protein VFH47_01435 [Candidatus Thermoplasmatota archaeon]|nr:hypothetical protein [Candidatus Thermoplasmatota archaeon]